MRGWCAKVRDECGCIKRSGGALKSGMSEGTLRSGMSWAKIRDEWGRAKIRKIRDGFPLFLSDI